MIVRSSALLRSPTPPKEASGSVLQNLENGSFPELFVYVIGTFKAFPDE